MTRTYAQVMKQIEGLQAQADKLRQKEIEGVVARIREAIEHYRLTAADLGLDGGSKKAQPLRKRAAAKKSAVVAKYRDELGRIWGGRGKRPQWLRDALAAGKTLQDFEVH